MPKALQVWGASGFWVLRLGFRSGLFDRRHFWQEGDGGNLGLARIERVKKENPGRMVCAQRLPSILSNYP